MAFSDLDALLTNEIAAEKLKGCSIFVQKGNKTLSKNPTVATRMILFTKSIQCQNQSPLLP